MLTEATGLKFRIKENIQIIIAIGVFIGMIMSSISYFAKASDLQLVSLRLEQKIVSDQVMDINRQMWQLEDRNIGKAFDVWPQRDKNEYRLLRERLERAKKKEILMDLKGD